MQVATAGLDLAKNIFQVHGITSEGNTVFNRPLRCPQVLSFFERLEPCLIGIEACGTSHHWARGLARVISFAEGVVEGTDLGLPSAAQGVIRNLSRELRILHSQVRWQEAGLRLEAKRDARVQLLQTAPGAGAVTAPAIAATIGDGHQFRNGREFAAWLGLTLASKPSGG